MTTVYEYTDTGRVVTVVSPTGSRVGVTSWMGGEGSQRCLSVGIGSVPSQPDTPQGTSHTLALTHKGKAVFQHGEYCFIINFFYVDKHG